MLYCFGVCFKCIIFVKKRYIIRDALVRHYPSLLTDHIIQHAHGAARWLTTQRNAAERLGL